MISLDFSWAVALYTFILVSVIFFSWLRNKRKKDKDLSLDPRFIWFCSVCAYTYINTKEDKISLCPRCGSWNKKN